MAKVQTLIHRNEPLAWQVKISKCRHPMLRLIRNESGLVYTKWRRVSAEVIAEVRDSCIVSEVIR